MDRIRKIESYNGLYIHGDGGKALGPYQFHKRTWDHVSEIRSSSGLPTKEYYSGARDETWSREYCRSYCQWIEEGLSLELGWVTPNLVYAAYNNGLSKVVLIRGVLKKLPPDRYRIMLKFDRTK